MGFLPFLFIFLAGCSSQQMAYPVLVQDDTFGFARTWWDKSVVYVQILTKDESVVGVSDMPALVSPCGGATVEQMQSLGPFTTEWAVRAVRPLTAKEFRLIPGHVPDGFEQIIPTDGQPFTPVQGQTYFIMVCLEPMDEKIYSLGVPWTANESR